MKIELDIDSELLKEALKMGGIKTNKETVRAALPELVQGRKERGIIDLFGSVEYDRTYNYKLWR